MKKQQHNKWFVALFLFLFASGLGLSIFLLSRGTYQLNAAVKQKTLYNVVKAAPLSGKNIIDSLQVLKIAYDSILEERNELYDQLLVEKKNVERLMEVIKSSQQPTASEIAIYRKQLADLRAVLTAKKAETLVLNSQHNNLLNELKDRNDVINRQKAINDTLVLNQKKMESAIKSATKLDFHSFKVSAIRAKKSGEEQETDKAKNTTKLKVSFVISGNSVAKTGAKVYYVQILDQDNTVLGENKLVDFGGNRGLVYSFLVAADFQGKAVTVVGSLDTEREFSKGTYFVNFFDEDEIIGTTSVTLK
jgi:hypothetical protein